MPHMMGPQFIRVFRGIHANRFHDQDMDTIDTEDASSHWSLDHQVAENFASGNDIPHGPGEIKKSVIAAKSGVQGIVLEGLVHKDDVHKWHGPGSRCGEFDRSRQIYHPNYPYEQEANIKDGATVHLTRAAKMKVDNRFDMTALTGVPHDKNKVTYTESQDFSSPIPAKVKGEEYLQNQLKAGKQMDFDLGLPK